MMTAFDTYLTDDPNVSEYHQAELPAGTKLTALSHPDRWAYIYVEATVDGKITRGFVPQRDVVFDDVELPDEEAKLVGSWQMEAGGEFWDTYLRLDADGRFYGSTARSRITAHGALCRRLRAAISTGGATFRQSSSAVSTAQCTATALKCPMITR